MTPARRPGTPTEAQFSAQVVELARMLGYDHVAHFRPAQSRAGRWSTPMTGDVGFPDLVLVRGRDGRLAFLELKVPPRKATPEQIAWLESLRAVPGILALVVYPADLEELAALLR